MDHLKLKDHCDERDYVSILRMREMVDKHWKFYGLIPVFNPVSQFGIKVGKRRFCGIFGNSVCIAPQTESTSPEHPKELKLISRGLTTAIIFRGSPNGAILRRMKAIRYNSADIKLYIQKPEDILLPPIRYTT